MNPRVRGGLGEIMFDVARDLTKEMWNFRYTGRCLIGDSDSGTISLSDDMLVFILRRIFNVARPSPDLSLGRRLDEKFKLSTLPKSPKLPKSPQTSCCMSRGHVRVIHAVHDLFKEGFPSGSLVLSLRSSPASFGCENAKIKPRPSQTFWP